MMRDDMTPQEKDAEIRSQIVVSGFAAVLQSDVTSTLCNSEFCRKLGLERSADWDRRMISVVGYVEPMRFRFGNFRIMSPGLIRAWTTKADSGTVSVMWQVHWNPMRAGISEPKLWFPEIRVSGIDFDDAERNRTDIDLLTAHFRTAFISMVAEMKEKEWKFECEFQRTAMEELAKAADGRARIGRTEADE